jgi:putative FmdB family regulatory protein
MPIYEYQCGDCGKVAEFRESIAAARGEHACPACGGTAMNKLLSAFAVGRTAQAAASAACGPGEDCMMDPRSGCCPCMPE